MKRLRTTVRTKNVDGIEMVFREDIEGEIRRRMTTCFHVGRMQEARAFESILALLDRSVEL